MATVEPTNRNPGMLQRLIEAAPVFGACSAKPAWATGYRPQTKVGHTTVLVPSARSSLTPCAPGAIHTCNTAQ